MGTFLSKKNRIEPVCSNREMRVERRNVSRRRFCWCFGNKVAPVCSSTYDIQEIRSRLFSTHGSSADIKEGENIEISSRSNSVRDLFIPRSEHMNRILAFQSEKKPLPKIRGKAEDAANTSDASNERPVSRNDKLKSIAFAVDINGIPIPNAIGNAVLRPLRLKRLPEMDKRVNLATLNLAYDGRHSCAFAKKAAPKILSKEMLEKLEAEKQREIDLRCKEKQIQAEIRRQLLMDQKEESLKQAEKRRMQAKDNIVAQTEQISVAAQNKIRRAEERKADMRLRIAEKKELARLRQENAKKNTEVQERQLVCSTTENIQNKMRRSEERKEELRQKALEKKEVAVKRQEDAKQNIEAQQRSTSCSVEDTLRNKMRRVEERKAALRQKAEEKKEMARIRRLRASIKSRLSKLEDSAMNAERNSDRQRELYNDDEFDDNVLGEIETAPSDEDPDEFNFNDDNISNESDSFWEIA